MVSHFDCILSTCIHTYYSHTDKARIRCIPFRCTGTLDNIIGKVHIALVSDRVDSFIPLNGTTN